MSGRVVRFAPWVLIGFTVVLWCSRLRNVLNDDDLSSSGRAVRIGVVVVFVTLAVAAGVGLRRRQQGWLVGLAVWGIGYWLVRGGGILIGDWSIGFKVVHTVLMVVSLALSALALRAVFEAGTQRRSG